MDCAFTTTGTGPRQFAVCVLGRSTFFVPQDDTSPIAELNGVHSAPYQMNETSGEERLSGMVPSGLPFPAVDAELSMATKVGPKPTAEDSIIA